MKLNENPSINLLPQPLISMAATDYWERHHGKQNHGDNPRTYNTYYYSFFFNYYYNQLF